MGKLIPPRSDSPAIRPVHVVDPREGPLQKDAHGLRDQLRSVEEQFDLDELDRLARQHARAPATGSPEALEALAMVVRCAPELFVRTEVNLSPERLESIADRERALGTLNSAIARLSDLVKDSQMEQGDEVVELLSVGMTRASALDKGRLYSNDRLATAMDVLAAYQQRVVEEQAHRSAMEIAGTEKKVTRKKKRNG